MDFQPNVPAADNNFSPHKDEDKIWKKKFKIARNGQFQCTECEIQYNEREAVRSHYLREHMDPEWIKHKKVTLVCHKIGSSPFSKKFFTH